jgi:hypothetical protein
VSESFSEALQQSLKTLRRFPGGIAEWCDFHRTSQIYIWSKSLKITIIIIALPGMRTAIYMHIITNT